MSACEKCQDLFDLYNAGQLNDEEKTFVEDHLAHCADCTEIFADWQKLEQLLVIWANEEIEPPTDFRGALFEKLEAKSLEIIPLSPQKSWMKRHQRTVMSLAVAAVLLMAILPTVLSVNTQSKAGKLEHNPLIAIQNDSLLSATSPEASTEQAVDSAKDSGQPALGNAEKQITPGLFDTDPQSSEVSSQDAVTQEAEVVLPKDGVNADAEPQLAELPEDGADNNAKTPMIFSAGRAAPIPQEVDWDSFNESTTLELKQDQERLVELQQDYLDEPTDERAEDIRNMEKIIRQVEARLKAIEAKDLEQLESSYTVE